MSDDAEDIEKAKKNKEDNIRIYALNQIVNIIQIFKVTNWLLNFRVLQKEIWRKLLIFASMPHISTRVDIVWDNKHCSSYTHWSHTLKRHILEKQKQVVR